MYIYFFHSNTLLTKHQSGFHPYDPTVSQLAYLYYTFYETLNKKKEVRIVFYDISKEFDRVWHGGLLFKLPSKALFLTGSLVIYTVENKE